jgi:hypothetical protein
MIEGGLDNLDKVDAGEVDAEEPLEVDKMLGGEGVDRNEGVVVMVDGDGDVVVDAVVVVGGGVMMVGGGKLVVEVVVEVDVAIGMSLTLATLGV